VKQNSDGGSMSYIVHHRLSISLEYLLQQPQPASLEFTIEIQKLKKEKKNQELKEVESGRAWR